MRVVVWLGSSPIEFTEPNAGGKWPYLLDVGDIRKAARAAPSSGLGSTETTSVPVKLLNGESKRAASILGYPLRCAADIYDDRDVLVLEGTISGLTYSEDLDLEVGT